MKRAVILCAALGAVALWGSTFVSAVPAKPSAEAGPIVYAVVKTGKVSAKPSDASFGTFDREGVVSARRVKRGRYCIKLTTPRPRLVVTATPASFFPDPTDRALSGTDTVVWLVKSRDCTSSSAAATVAGEDIEIATFRGGKPSDVVSFAVNGSA